MNKWSNTRMQKYSPPIYIYMYISRNTNLTGPCYHDFHSKLKQSQTSLETWFSAHGDSKSTKMSIQSAPKFKFLLETIKTWESCSRQHAVSIFNVISTAAALCSLFLITLYPPASAAGAFRKSQELKTDSSARNDTRMYGEAQNPLLDQLNIEICSQPRYIIDQHVP